MRRIKTLYNLNKKTPDEVGELAMNRQENHAIQLIWKDSEQVSLYRYVWHKVS